MALAAFTFASCSVDSSEPAKDPITKEDPETPATPAVPEVPSTPSTPESPSDKKDEDEIEEIPDSVEGLKVFTSLNVSNMSAKTYSKNEVVLENKVQS